MKKLYERPKGNVSDIIRKAAQQVGLLPIYSTDEKEFTALSNNINQTALLNIIKTSNSNKNKYLAASHPNLTSPIHLSSLSKGKDPFVVAGVASNPNADPELLEEIYSALQPGSEVSVQSGPYKGMLGTTEEMDLEKEEGSPIYDVDLQQGGGAVKIPEKDLWRKPMFFGSSGEMILEKLATNPNTPSYIKLKAQDHFFGKKKEAQFEIIPPKCPKCGGTRYYLSTTSAEKLVGFVDVSDPDWKGMIDWEPPESGGGSSEIQRVRNIYNIECVDCSKILYRKPKTSSFGKKKEAFPGKSIKQLLPLRPGMTQESLPKIWGEPLIQILKENGFEVRDKGSLINELAQLEYDDVWALRDNIAEGNFEDILLFFPTSITKRASQKLASTTWKDMSMPQPRPGWQAQYSKNPNIVVTVDRADEKGVYVDPVDDEASELMLDMVFTKDSEASLSDVIWERESEFYIYAGDGFRTGKWQLFDTKGTPVLPDHKGYSSKKEATNILEDSFWVVTYPTPVSELGDIFFESDFNKLELQFRGGLKYEDIHGIYNDEEEARQTATGLLNRRTSAKKEKEDEAPEVEIGVHYHVCSGCDYKQDCKNPDCELDPGDEKSQKSCKFCKPEEGAYDLTQEEQLDSAEGEGIMKVESLNLRRISQRGVTVQHEGIEDPETGELIHRYYFTEPDGTEVDLPWGESGHFPDEGSIFEHPLTDEPLRLDAIWS